MKVKIEVTKDDIKNGKLDHSSKCPVALAMKRKIKNMVWVFSEEFYLKDYMGFYKSYDMPKKTGDRITKFDGAKDKNTKNMTPFSFVVNVPEKFVKRLN